MHASKIIIALLSLIALGLIIIVQPGTKAASANPTPLPIPDADSAHDAPDYYCGMQPQTMTESAAQPPLWSLR